jgi:hypothetical protein
MGKVVAQLGRGLFYDTELAKEIPWETSIKTAVSGKRFETWNYE